MSVATGWYDSGFWKIAVPAACSLASAAIGVWGGRRLAYPKRRLIYCRRKNISLLNASDQAANALNVTHGGIALQRPRIVEVELKNVGRQDIAATAFHDSDPVTFDLGAMAVAVLDAQSYPQTTTAPKVNTSGQVLEVLPCRLARKQVVVYSVLVDGPLAELGCRSSLIDIDVIEEAAVDEEARHARSARLLRVKLVAAFVIFAFSFSAIYIQAITSSNEKILDRESVIRQLEDCRRLEKEKPGIDFGSTCPPIRYRR